MDDQRGVSSVMGVVLLLGMTLMVVSVILASSVVVLGDAQSDARISQMENSMSQLSSKASLVALGDSNSHRFNLGNVDRSEVETRPDAGHLRIIYNVNETKNVTLHDEPLGALVYENGDVEIAYQGGGVWKKQGDWSTMISPPEFYYQSATLTFPIIQVTGDDLGSGTVEGRISTDGVHENIYPNESYRNPLTNGTVVVEVESEYYNGWVEFFDERTEGEIEVDSTNKTVRANLRTLSDMGDITLQDGLQIAGVNETGMEAFNFNFVADHASGFNPITGSLYSPENENNEEFEIYIDPDDDESTIIVYFRDSEREHLWKGTTDEFQAVESEENDHYYEFYIDLTSTNTTLNYTTSTENLEAGIVPEDPSDNATIDNKTYYENGPGEALGTIIDHYLISMEGTINFEYIDQTSKGQSSTNVEASSGYVDYDPTGDIIQYLHVTRQSVEIRPD